MSYDPFKQMGPGMFNPGVAGRMAARKENEESQLRKLQQMNSYSLIKDRMSRLKDFEAGSEARRAREQYDMTYDRARLKHAGARADTEQGKLVTDQQTAQFDLRNKRHKMAQDIMPAIMRIAAKDPVAGQKMFELFAPLMGGMDMGTAGQTYGDPLQTPQHQRKLDELRVQGRNQMAVQGARNAGKGNKKRLYNVEQPSGDGSPPVQSQRSMTDDEVADFVSRGGRVHGTVGSTPQPTKQQSLTGAGGPVATYVLSNGSTYVGTLKEAQNYAAGQGLEVVDIQSRRKADGGGGILPPNESFGRKNPIAGAAATSRPVTKIDKNGNIIK